MLIQRNKKDAKSTRKQVIFGYVVGGDIAGGDDADEKGDVDEDVDGGADGDIDGGDANHGGLVCNYVASCIYVVGGNVDNIVSHVNAVIVGGGGGFGGGDDGGDDDDVDGGDTNHGGLVCDGVAC